MARPRTRKKPPPRVDKGPIRDPSSEAVEHDAPPRVVERREVDGVIYQREWVKCGTATCRCMRGGQGHGPYWYAYRLARAGGGKAGKGGRWVSVYVGRDFRELD
jgi:hypothetical protein